MPGRYSPQGNYDLTLSEVLSQYIIDYPVLIIDEVMTKQNKKNIIFILS